MGSATVTAHPEAFGCAGSRARTKPGGAGELMLTWVRLAGGPRSFWLLGCGGVEDIPKAVV